MNLKFDWKNNKANVLKLVAVLALAAVVLVISLNTLSSSLGLTPAPDFFSGNSVSESSGKGTDSFGVATPTLSDRNIVSRPPTTQPVPGTDAEQYEVKQYTATIETSNLDRDCSRLADLKAREDVIFENSYQYEHGCNYTFKVPKAQTAEIVDLLKSLDPKNLAENVYSIKTQINDYTSQTDILLRKKETIESTLDDATNSYSQLTKLATEGHDVETLAKIIDSKIRIIEQLTQERLSVTDQLDQLSRAKAEALDRLDYTYFYVTIFENKYIDGQVIKDSWKAAVKQTVLTINETLQQLSIGLLSLILIVIQYGLYLLLLLILGKWGWRFARNYWQK